MDRWDILKFHYRVFVVTRGLLPVLFGICVIYSAISEPRGAFKNGRQVALQSSLSGASGALFDSVEKIEENASRKKSESKHADCICLAAFVAGSGGVRYI